MDDTVSLLKECDAGLIMARDSLTQALNYAKAHNFSNMLKKYYDEHTKLETDVKNKLLENNEGEKKPNVIGRTAAKGMTNMKLMLNGRDEKIADIMMDGCNMGIKNVSKYMNQYGGSKEDALRLANSIVVLEQNFANELRQYL